MRKNLTFMSMIVFSLALMACNQAPVDDKEASVFEDTHNVEKIVEIGDAEWAEIVTPGDSSSYEMWISQNGAEPTMVGTFEQSNFSTLEWEENEEGGINLTYWNGGPEGGTSTIVVYDKDGSELVRTMQDLPWQSYEFILKTPKHEGYMVAYLTEGECSEDNLEVDLLGLSISSGASTYNFMLPEKIANAECKSMDGNFVNPPLEITEVGGHSLDIKLANGQNARVDYFGPVNESGLTWPGISINGTVIEPELAST